MQTRKILPPRRVTALIYIHLTSGCLAKYCLVVADRDRFYHLCRYRSLKLLLAGIGTYRPTSYELNWHQTVTATVTATANVTVPVSTPWPCQCPLLSQSLLVPGPVTAIVTVSATACCRPQLRHRLCSLPSGDGPGSPPCRSGVAPVRRRRSGVAPVRR